MSQRQDRCVPSATDPREVNTSVFEGMCPTCVTEVAVQLPGVLIHDVNHDDNQVCQADWI